MTLSILICTLPKRAHMLSSLFKNLNRQWTEGVEIITNNLTTITTGAKRNWLVKEAKGEYIVFIDDDDEVSPEYIKTILEALKSNPDVVGFNGQMTTNGRNSQAFRIKKDNPYESITEGGRTVYLRYNNHLSPIKREIAIQFPFPDISHGEDYVWATEIHKSGLIKTEVYINKDLYHYKYVKNK